MSLFKNFLFGSIFFVFSSVLCSAQNADITGTVTSEYGVPVSGAHVYLSPEKWAVADDMGVFSIEGVDKGTYTIKVSSIGFQLYRSELTIQSGDLLNLNIILETEIYEDKPVVITASRTQKELEEVSVPVTVVNNKEIELSGSLRLSDILNEQIGLNVVSDHGTGIQVQGFDPEYTLIMIDNQPVIGRTAGTLNLDRLAVGDVKQIEIVKGPSSALWGSDALAGVINIITEKGSAPISADVSGRYGSNTSYDGSANVKFKKNNFNGRFFSNINSSAGYDLNEATVAPTIPEYQNYTLSGGMDYRVSSTLGISLNGRFYKESQSYNDEINVSGEPFDLDGSEFQQNYSLTPELSLNFGSGFLIEATGFISSFDSESKLDYTDSSASYFYDSFEQTLNKIELKASSYWNEKHTTVAGIGMNREDLTADIYADIPYFDSYFSFGQHEWTLSDKISFTAGFRYDNHSEYDSQFSPKFSGLYRPNDFVHFRASIGGGFKAPDFRQLFLNFTNPVAGYSVFGSSTVVEGIAQLQADNKIEELYYNPSDIAEITAEHSYAYNAGLDIFPGKGVQLRTNFFRNNVQDLIETQRIALKTNGQSVFGYFNLNRIHTQGIETELRYRPDFLNGLNIALGYQFLDAKRELKKTVDRVENGVVVTVTETTYEDMFNRSRHTGNLKLFYSIKPLGLDASVRIQYRGKYGFADLNVNDRIDSNEYTNDYVLVNTSVAKTFRERFRLQLGINNLTNYQDAQFLPSNPGITFYTQLNIKLQ